MVDQEKLAAGGNFLSAFNIDAAVVEAKFPGKYTEAIGQARAYAERLKETGHAK